MKIGIVGGTVLLETNALTDRQERLIETPFGPAELDEGSLEGIPVALIQRHGRAKNRPPHRIPYAANCWALRNAGVEQVLGLASAGCLQEGVSLPAVCIPHDYVAFGDATTVTDALRHVTPGFDEGIRQVLVRAARAEPGVRVLEKGVYWQSRGPRLETRAEVAFLRPFAACVGMTAGSEATVAMELGIRYAALCSLDNYAHGIGPAAPTDGEIRRVAAENAGSCLRILGRAVRELTR